MTMVSAAVQMAGFGLIVSPVTVSASDALGTTPVKVALPDISAVSGGRPRTFSVDIVNPNASAVIAWQLVPRGAAAPVFAASFAAAGDKGAPVLPGTTRNFAFESAWDLYVVSDTAAQKYAAVIEMY